MELNDSVGVKPTTARKSCECGKVWTDQVQQIWCEKCKTFTMAVYARQAVGDN